MFYERNRLELVDENDKKASRALRLYGSDKLYGANGKVPKYVLPILFLCVIGLMAMASALILFAGKVFMNAAIGNSDILFLLTFGAVITVPQVIYWELTRMNEARLENYIEQGRVRVL